MSSPGGVGSGAPETGTGAASRRVAWVDSGRGIAITLVVVYHAAQWLPSPGFDTDVWQRVNDVLATLRMPLFFTISGMYAGKWVTGTWTGIWRRKVSLFLWVYLVWSFIATGPFILGLIMQGERGNFLSQYQYVLTAPLEPRFELWFIWALSIFFIVFRLLRAVPGLTLLVPAAVISALALSVVDLGNVGWEGLLKYAFFFLLGLHCRPTLLSVGESRHFFRLSGLACLWAVAAVTGVARGWNDIPGYYFMTALLGVVTGISLSRLMQPMLWLRRIGQQTLPIYLAHTSVILIIAWPLQYLPEVWKDAAAAAPLVPLVAAVALGISLWLHSNLVQLSIGRLLYSPPTWVEAPHRRTRGRAQKQGEGQHKQVSG